MKKVIKMTNEKNLTLEEGFSLFIRKKEAENVSKDTITYYKESYKYFSEFINPLTLCRDITQESFYEYIRYLKNNKSHLSTVTMNTRLRGIRVILYFLIEEGYIIPFKIKLMKSEETLIETYSEDELTKLLKKPNTKTCSFAEYRNWVIVNYLLATGNRLKTVCNLKINDLNFENHEVRLLKTKTKKVYTIPISNVLEKILKEYLIQRNGKDDEYLFCTIYGTKLAKSALQSAIENYNHKCGVDKRSIHKFRHTFAKHWILNGGDIFRLQAILGHTTLDMTKKYVNVFGRDLHVDFNTFNPLDNISKNLKGNHIKISR